MNLQIIPPADFKTLARSLRTLPAAPVPTIMHETIMQALPRRRGFLGRVEYALKRDLAPGGPARKPFTPLPSTPPEYGMSLLCAGVFFFALSLAIAIGAQTTGLRVLSAEPVLAASLALFLCGSALLALAGWVQIKSAQTIVAQGLRLVVACLLYGLVMALGFAANTQHVSGNIMTLLGMSGLIVSSGLALMPRMVPIGWQEGRTRGHDQGLGLPV